MRLSVTKSKYSQNLYVIKSTFENGKHSTRIVEKLGTYDEIKKRLNGGDPVEWARKYIEELNSQKVSEPQDVLLKYSPAKVLSKDDKRCFNGGYLFLQSVYSALGLPKVCSSLAGKHSFEFDLNSVFSRLIYARILFPCSKLATWRVSQTFVEEPRFMLHHVYRALEVLASESDFIQASLYAHSRKLVKRHTGVIYYDCTNYFFEIEREDGDKRYGFSKEHRPNPVVQMGLFMDSDGIPLAFCINPGNTNEQTTLQPIEKRIASDFKLSKFVVCTDAGLASAANRRFNDKPDRGFITTQSVKKTRKYIKEWMLAKDGWRVCGDSKLYDIDAIGSDDTLSERFRDKVFYKERWIKEDGLEERLIVTWSSKYRDYQRAIRTRQIERAVNTMDHAPGKLDKCGQNDYKRFIRKEHSTMAGEKASVQKLSLNEDVIHEEERYDGYYAAATNLEDDASVITGIVHRRWEIEECFRIMKSEFKARPVYLSRDDRIQAHFLVCFVALVVYRILEKKLKDKYTCGEIITGLKEMNFLKIKGEGYIPTYTRTDLTDALHETFKFHTDYQIVTLKKMKEILRQTQA